MTRGNPRFCVRLPMAVLTVLKQMAQDMNTTPSNILRDLTIKELKRAGYSLEPKKGEEPIA